MEGGLHLLDVETDRTRVMTLIVLGCLRILIVQRAAYFVLNIHAGNRVVENIINHAQLGMTAGGIVALFSDVSQVLVMGGYGGVQGALFFIIRKYLLN